MGKILLFFILLKVGVAGASIFPKNAEIYRPNQKQIVKTGGLTRSQVDQVLTLFKTRLASDFKGRSLTIFYYNEWSNNEVNAYAAFIGGDYKIRKIAVLGGLSRHPWITQDALKMVVCHEVGHHIGGAPMYSDGYMSSEGQSDYFATLKCFRKLHTAQENALWRSESEPSLKAFNICKNDNVCLRSVGAADILMGMLSYGRTDLSKTDKNVVNYTLHDEYPSNQCRLDTYVAGARGLSRPLCWFYK